MRLSWYVRSDRMHSRGETAPVSPFQALSGGNPYPDSFRSSSNDIIHHYNGFVNHLGQKKNKKSRKNIDKLL